MLRHIFLGMGAFSIVPTAFTANSIVEYNNQYDLLENLKTSIKNSSTLIGSEKIYEVNNQEFTQSQYDNYFSQHFVPQNVLTSSDPGKIIKDYDNNILDENKVYSADPKDAQLVYRDAFGNAQVLKQKALNSFTNEGLVKPKYSYDYVNYFDTPEEAKESFNFTGGLEKSLYYQTGGRYYNLFNKKDKEKLKNTLSNGFHMKSNSVISKSIFGSKEDFKNNLKNKLRDYWSKNNPGNSNDEFSRLNLNNFLEVKEKNSLITVGVEGGKNGDKIQINGNDVGDSVSISVKGTGFKKLLENKRNYNVTDEKDSLGITTIRKISTFKYNDSEDKRSLIDQNTNRAIGFKILPKNTRWDPAFKGPTDVSWGEVKVTEQTSTKLTLKDIKNDILILDDLEYKKDIGVQDGKNFVGLSKDDVNDIYEKWFTYWYDNQFLDFSSVDGEGYNKYGIKRDILYSVNGSKGYDYSFVETEKWFNEKIKPSILNGDSKVIDGVIHYKLREDFWINEEQLNNYTYLMGDQDIRLMYTFTGEKDVSSIDGMALAPTEYEAREKLFQIQKGILTKKWFAYDVFGEYAESGNDAQTAIKKLQDSIDLQTRYVATKEIDSWKSGVYSFDDVISSGAYLIYRVTIDSKTLFFLNFEDAYKSIEAGFSKDFKVNSEYKPLFSYGYDFEDQFKEYTYFSDYQLTEIALEILNYEKK